VRPIDKKWDSGKNVESCLTASQEVKIQRARQDYEIFRGGSGLSNKAILWPGRLLVMTREVVESRNC